MGRIPSIYKWADDPKAKPRASRLYAWACYHLLHYTDINQKHDPDYVNAALQLAGFKDVMKELRAREPLAYYLVQMWIKGTPAELGTALYRSTEKKFAREWLPPVLYDLVDRACVEWEQNGVTFAHADQLLKQDASEGAGGRWVGWVAVPDWRGAPDDSQGGADET